MITEFLMYLIMLLVGVLPDWTPLGIASEYVENLMEVEFIQSAIGIARWLDHYLPVETALDLLGYTIVILGLGWAYSGIMWLWRNLPGKAT
jgi:hypothetical protein